MYISSEDAKNNSKAKGVPDDMRPLLFPSLIAVSALAGASADDSYFDESDLLIEIPTVSSGARMEQARHQSPSSVTVITSQMIAAMAPNNLVEVFRLVPGFLSFYTNGSLYGVSSHDFTDDDPRRVDVRVNGRSVYVPAYPTVSWESLGITPNDIERIEVVRGSNVPAYGSNAIIGAIHIFTKSPVREAGFFLRATAGDSNTRNVHGQGNFSIASDGYGQIRVAHRENDGFDGLMDEGSVDHLVLNTEFTRSLNENLRLELGVSNGSFFIGDGDHPTLFAEDQNRSHWATSTYSQNGENQTLNWHLSFYDVQFKQQGINTYGERSNQIWEAELEQDYQFSNRLRAASGLGYRHQHIKSPGNLEFDNSVNNEIYYAFSNLEWKINTQWMTNWGLMAEEQQTDSLRISPRLSLHYQLNPQHNFRASVSKTHRSPTIWEYSREQTEPSDGDFIDYNLVSDKQMSAEKMDSAELAYYGRYWKGTLDLDLRLFREEMTGAIDHASWREMAPPNAKNSFPYDQKVNVFGNNKDWRIRGYDLQAIWRPATGTAVYLQYANTNFSASRVAKIYPDVILSGREEDGVPQRTASLFITQQFDDGWSASLLSYHQSRTKWRGGSSDPINSWLRHDLAVTKQIALGDRQLRIDFKLENLTDENYLEYQDGNVARRKLFLSTELIW